MEQNSFYQIEQASEMSKITHSVIVYAPCPSKTITKSNKKQMNSSADTFFLMTRYLLSNQIDKTNTQYAHPLIIKNVSRVKILLMLLSSKFYKIVGYCGHNMHAISMKKIKRQTFD